MAGKQGSKIKLLAVLEILWNCSDDDHVLTANEICEKLEEYNIIAERKSIYADIDNLCKFGVDIVNTKSPSRGFFLASRQFQVAEVRLLADAVQAANFITSKKAKALKEKLYGLLSNSQADIIDKQIITESKLKCTNEELYYTIDTINCAIKDEKKIEFKYIKRRMTERTTSGTEEKSFIVSPYALIWNDDRYYLVSNNSKYDNLMHTRLDRMGKVTILEEKVRSFTEVSEYKGTFDAADYACKHLNMFTGSVKNIELRCSNAIIDDILDRFGCDIPLCMDGEGYFIIRVKTAVSRGLVSWILQYGADIEVRSPKDLVNDVKEKAKSIWILYEMKKSSLHSEVFDSA